MAVDRDRLGQPRSGQPRRLRVRLSCCCLQPTDAQTLPLIGSLLAFRGVYYLLPLVCGVVVLAVSELHRWRVALARLIDRLRLDLGSDTGKVSAALVFLGGLGLIVAATVQGPDDVAESSAQLARALPEIGRAIEIVGGLALVLLARGLWQRLAVAWPWVLGLVLAGAVGALHDRRASCAQPVSGDTRRHARSPRAAPSTAMAAPRFGSHRPWPCCWP